MRLEEVLILVAPFVPGDERIGFLYVNKYIRSRLYSSFQYVFQDHTFIVPWYAVGFTFLKIFGRDILRLNISQSSRICDIHIEYVPNVRILHIGEKNILHDYSLRNFKYLKYLNIQNTSTFSDEIFKYSPDLVRLDISECSDGLIGENFGNLKKLKRLDMDRYRIKDIDEISKHLSKLTELKILNMRFLNGKKRINSNIFKNLSKLEELNMEGYGSSKNIMGAEVFQNLSSLKKLDLSYRAYVEFDDETFKNLKNLEYLNLKRSHSSIVNSTFKYIENCKNLIYLNVSELHKKCISDKIFGYISECRKLKYLDISDNYKCKFTDKAFEYIGRLEKLEELKMKDCRQESITDETFKSLKNCKNLRRLNMSWCSQKTITIDAIEYISEYESLEYLNIKNTSFDDTELDTSSLYNGKKNIVVERNRYKYYRDQFEERLNNKKMIPGTIMDILNL